MKKLVCVLLLLAPAAAWAQSPQEKAAASALFEEGRKLRKEGKLAQACAKFEAAQRLAPTLGHKLNLADCYRRMGRTASAWAEFREAASEAAGEHDDERENFARQEVKELEKGLSRLTVKLSPGAKIEGLEVTRDGIKMDRALLNNAIPVDPGSHVVEASAPGRTAWSSKVHVSDGASVVVEVPVLGEPTHYTEPAPAAAAAVPETAPSPAPGTEGRPGGGRRLISYVVGGAGVVALGTGLVFGQLARSKNNRAHSGHCDANNVCDQVGFDLVKAAQSRAVVSTVMVGVGVAAIAGGIVLYLTAPHGESREKQARVRVTPSVGVGSVGLAVSGGF